MLHWPDSMFAYLNEEELLFSQDAFGMHFASLERFDDEIDPAILDYEAATYYANILLPYSPLVLKLLEKVTAAGLSFKIIAPDHGPVWRKDIGGIIGRYARWAAQKPTAKAVVVYATMWHSTEKMARAIGEGLAAGGLRVKLMSMDEVHRSDVVYELLGAGALAVGSSTLNNNMLPEHGGRHDLSAGDSSRRTSSAPPSGPTAGAARRCKPVRRDSAGDEGGDCRGGDPREECSR